MSVYLFVSCVMDSHAKHGLQVTKQKPAENCMDLSEKDDYQFTESAFSLSICYFFSKLKLCSVSIYLS